MMDMLVQCYVYILCYLYRRMRHDTNGDVARAFLLQSVDLWCSLLLGQLGLHCCKYSSVLVECCPCLSVNIGAIQVLRNVFSPPSHNANNVGPYIFVMPICDDDYTPLLLKNALRNTCMAPHTGVREGGRGGSCPPIRAVCRYEFGQRGDIIRAKHNTCLNNPNLGSVTGANGKKTRI